MGLTTQLDHVAEDESPLVTALEAQGAVIFVKTNVPATLMSANTVNYIFGRTQNVSIVPEVVCLVSLSLTSLSRP